MAPPSSKEETKETGSKKPSDDRGIAFGTGVAYDDAYGATTGGDDEYVSELPTMEEEERRRRGVEEEMDEGRVSSHPSTMKAGAASGREVCTTSTVLLLRQYPIIETPILTTPTSFPSNQPGDDDDPFKNSDGGSGLVNTRIADRESDYQKRRHNRVLRDDNMSYAEAMTHANLDREKHELIQEARKELLDDDGNMKEEPKPEAAERRRKRRYYGTCQGRSVARFR
jgi:hypothetical protein